MGLFVRFFSLLCLFIGACSQVLINAQTNAGTEAATTIHARTQLVVVPVVVTKSGKHVPGLKAEDFVVEEDGVAQKIAQFEEITTSTERVTRSKPQDRSFSNMLQSAESPHRVTIFLIDMVNTRYVDQKRGRDALLQSLSQALELTEPTALYVVSPTGLKLIHDFTTSPKVLMAAVRQMRGSSDADLNRNYDPPEINAANDAAKKFEAAMKERNEVYNSTQRRIAAEITLEAMRQLANAYSGLPGRKAVVWVTSGFPFDMSDANMALTRPGRASLVEVSAIYERTWKTFNDANFAIYPVAPNGLNGFAEFDSETDRRYYRSDPESDLPGVRSDTNIPENWSLLNRQATLRTFADATGGRAYYNSNDIVKGFREAARDSAHYYEVSYYLTRNNSKPGWRKLHVKVSRAGVNVRARSGFFFTPAAEDQNSVGKEIATALSSPLDYTELPMQLSWLSFGVSQDAKKRTVKYEVYLPPGATFVDDSDNNHVHVQFVAQVRSSDGKVVAAPEAQTLEAHMKAETLQQVRTGGLRYRNALELPPGDYTVRFVTRDALSGKLGSVGATLTLEEPNAAKN